LVVDVVDGFRQGGAEALHLPEVYPLAHVVVLADEDVVDVEGEGLGPVLADDNRRVRAQGVAHAQLVEGVLVRGREVGDHHVRLQKSFVHRHVYHARVRYLVGARALHLGVDDGRLDDVLVSLVEVERAPRLEVGLLAEAHHDEAGAFWFRLGFCGHPRSLLV
jgi:hypothetical protein